MKKKKILLSTMMVLIAIGQANAQKAYTHVQQDGVKIDKHGTAAFEISPGSHPTLEFDANGKAVMKIGGNTVAALPTDDKGQLVIEFETSVSETNLNKVTKTFPDEYATLYSPFQLQMPESSTVEVYAPTYNAETHMVSCNSSTKIADKAVIPAETALLLKNAGTIKFAISDGASTDTHVSALSGSSLKIDVPALQSGFTLYTLGHESSDASKYGFFRYTGTQLNPGLAWLVAESLPSKAKYYAIILDEETTSIDDLQSTKNNDERVCKTIEKGSIVIVKRSAGTDACQGKNVRKYNLNGQELK